MASNEVIRFLRRKTDNGFDEPITYIGSEQRFVTPLINSGVNNLEEQYILGTDTYKETTLDDDGNIRIETSYHVNSDDPSVQFTNYYKVITTIYKDYMKRNIYFNTNQINLLNREEEVNPQDPTIYVTIQQDELYFVTNNGDTETPILTKITERKYENNGAKEIVRERIINHIAS